MKQHRLLSLSIIAVIITLLIPVMSGCGTAEANEIDSTLLANLEGEYRPTDQNKSWMILTIHQESGPILGDGPKVPYLAIFDDEAGEPGVEGEIISLDEETITIKIEKDYFERLPDSDWKTSNFNSQLTMNYTRSGDKLTLENNGKEMEFYDGSHGYVIEDDED